MKEKTMWIVGVIVLGCLWFGIIYIALRPQFEIGRLQTEIETLKLQIQKQELQKQLEGEQQ